MFRWQKCIHYWIYTDYDYVGCCDNRKSTSGYIFQFMGRVISWRSRLKCVALSTTKAKYVAISEAEEVV